MISVAMTTYNSVSNGNNYLKLQLDSIYNQIKKVDEVVIVDDCSSDNTFEFIQDYVNDNHLHNWNVVKNENNLGFIKTFQKAVSLCTGTLIFLCDHDDEWIKDKVEVISKIFEENENVLMLNSSFIQIDENSKECKVKQQKGKSNNNLIRRKLAVPKGLNKMYFDDISVYNISPGCTCAFRKELVVPFLNISSPIPHDLQLNILASLNDGLYYLDVPTTRYRIYSNNTIGLGHINQLEKRKKAVEKNLNEKRYIKNLLEEKYGAHDLELKMNEIISVYEERLRILNSKNVFVKILSLLIKTRKIPFFYESLLLDLKVVMRGK